MSALVALTGASGFIGQVVLKRLIEEGHKVRALVRKPHTNTDNIHWVQGDLSDNQALGELVKGVDAIIHCAAVVRGGALEAFVETNVTGTKHLIDAITVQENKPRFLLISSLAARQPDLSWYAKSKAMAEQVVIEASDKINYTIFRPTAVYGPGDKELRPIFIATRRGLLPVVGELTNQFSLLHVDDFVSAIQCWLASNEPIEGNFELGGNELNGYNYQSLALLTQEVWGHPVRCIKIPVPLVTTIAKTNLILSKYLHYAPMLTPGKVREFQHPNWVCDNIPLTHALGWKPEISLRNALPQLFS